jgi:hypothetical protein
MKLLEAVSTAVCATSAAAAGSEPSAAPAPARCSHLHKPSARFSCRAIAIRRAKAQALQQRLPVVLDV